MENEMQTDVNQVRWSALETRGHQGTVTIYF